MIFRLIALAVLVTTGALIFASLPDIKRYLRIRAM